MDYYKRKLPHLQPKGGEFFVTFRLANSLPGEVLDQIKEYRNYFKSIKNSKNISKWDMEKYQKKMFRFIDEKLDREESGPTWLKQKEIAELVMNSLHFYDNNYYELYAYTVMSNHVHVVFKHLEMNFDVDLPVTKIMQKIKSFTGKEANKTIGISGRFWETESYDRLIRNDDELFNVIKYVINNPVKAELIEDWKAWPYTYCKREFLESFE